MFCLQQVPCINVTNSPALPVAGLTFHFVRPPERMWQLKKSRAAIDLNPRTQIPAWIQCAYRPSHRQGRAPIDREEGDFLQATMSQTG